MKLAPLHYATAAFLAFAAAFVGAANLVLHFDPAAAEKRFALLYEAENFGGAALRGRRAAALGAFDNARAPARADAYRKLGVAHLETGRFDAAIAYHLAALEQLDAAGASPLELARMRALIGETALAAQRIDQAVEIYHGFLEAAGDYAVAADAALPRDSVKSYLAERIAMAGPLFAAAFEARDPAEIAARLDRRAALAYAEKSSDLAAFYADRRDDHKAALGLHQSALAAALAHLGPDDPYAQKLSLSLAQAHMDRGDLAAAENIYLDLFHLQERIKGPNNPTLSLYMKLLAGVYSRQGRRTEAEAIYGHIRRIFADSFGAQRYGPAGGTSVAPALRRPVSNAFPLEQEYRPPDLVPAREFGVPVAKDPLIDEMSVRLAADRPDAAPGDSMPARLAELLAICSRASAQEISLRSGFRSYHAQRYLHERNAQRGTVASAGASEHQSGLAVDLNVDGRFMRSSDMAYHCLQEQAFRFGFILSFPPGNDYLAGAGPFEPWHWRYVGVETARLYREYGPVGKPLEFLAEVTCYEELAAQGVSATASGEDVCLRGGASPMAGARPAAALRGAY